MHLQRREHFAELPAGKGIRQLIINDSGFSTGGRKVSIFLCSLNGGLMRISILMSPFERRIPFCAQNIPGMEQKMPA